MAANLARGIFYVATGPICRAEAAVSARSVKQVWPDIPIAIMTDGPAESALFDLVDIIPAEPDNIAKVRHVTRSPFESTLLLDTDTYCLAPLPELFDLLDHFDLAAAHEAGRFSTRWEAGTEVFIQAPDIPKSFPELNSGVVAFRRQPNVLKVFERWLALAEEARAAPVPHTQDQPAFRRAVYESDLRIAVLPPEYNFRLIISGFARGPIKLIHGRWRYGPIGKTPKESFAVLERTFNENVGPRVFVHAFGMICGHGPFAIAFDDPKRTCELAEVGELEEVRLLAGERNLYKVERDRSLVELERSLAKRDQVLADLDRSVAERNRSIVESEQLRTELAAVRREFDTIMRSKSWRITRPLRFLRHKLASPRKQA
jgi:uncharacterized coiled-coil protein SlyX